MKFTDIEYPFEKRDKSQKVNTKGQVVIPKSLREKCDVREGSILTFKHLGKNKFEVEVINDPIQALRDLLGGKFGKSSQQMKDEIRAEEAYYERRKFGLAEKGSSKFLAGKASVKNKKGKKKKVK